MSYIHQDPDFNALLRLVAQKRGLAVGLVEKDYWVTHTLWALQQSGLEVWFKGGTSLSKGYGLLQRFSEDLDLKLAAGKEVSLPAVSNWKGDGTKAVASRQEFFGALASAIKVPGAKVDLGPNQDKLWRFAAMQVRYTVKHQEAADVLRPFVLLEVGEARVTPFEARSLSSFVHDELDAQAKAGDYEANRPQGLRCVHPMVTLIEKLDAIPRRFPNAKVAPAAFVRHYEDVARIAQAKGLPALAGYSSNKALAEDLAAQKQIVAWPRPEDPAWAFGKGQRWQELEAAWQAIGPMFWGPRMGLEECCGVIRTWISEELK